jgi:hypothetical protein
MVSPTPLSKKAIKPIFYVFDNTTFISMEETMNG